MSNIVDDFTHKLWYIDIMDNAEGRKPPGSENE